MAEKKTFLDKFGALFLTAFVFLLPIFVFPSSLLPFQAGKALLVFIFSISLFVAWVVDRIRVGKVVIPKSFALAVLLGLVFVYFISALFSKSAFQGIVGRGFELDTAFSILSFFLISFLITQFFRTKQSIFNLYIAIFSSFFVLFIFSFIRFVAGPGVFSFGVLNTSVSNLIGSWNDFGVFFGLITILSMVMLEILPPKGILRFLLYFASALSLLALSVINFNSVWYVVGFFALALFVYSFAFAKVFDSEGNKILEFKDRNFLKLPKVPLVVVLFSIIFLITGSQFFSKEYPNLNVGNYISQKLNLVQLEARPSWATTFGVAINTLKTDPLIGVGPNQFYTEWIKYKPKVVNESAFWNVDFNFGIGIIPSAFVSVGLLGALFWIIFLSTFFYSSVRIIKKPKEDLFAYYLSVTSFVGAAYLWIMSIFYTTSTVPFAFAFIFTGACLASFIVSADIDEKTFSWNTEPSKRFAVLILSIVFIVSSATIIIMVTKRYISLAYFNNALSIFNTTSGLEGAEQNVRKAISVNEEDVYYRGLSEIALINLNIVASQVTPKTPPEEIREKLSLLMGGAIQSAQMARDINPANYQNWVSLAKTYEVFVPLKIAGAYENAKSNYIEAAKINPTNPAILLLLARLEVANGQNEVARNFIKQSIDLKGNYTDAIFLLSQIEVAEGNLKEAINSVESASVISPNDPTVFFQLGFLYYNNSDYKKAITSLERAVALEPSYANARYFLGLSYDKSKRKEDAIIQFENIEKTNPTNQEVKFILNNLRAEKDAFSKVAPPLDDKPEKRKKTPIEDRDQSSNL